MKKTYLIIAAAAGFAFSTQVAMAEINAEKLYNSKCKMCHKIDKKKIGPAFSKMNSDPAILKAVITDGRKMMPKFGKKLGEEKIDALVAFIKNTQQ
ncbi:MAG: cytochrome c [Mariprofundus sp.]|nr:cytochrome c [Mariprofundus sp.]